MSRTTCLCLLWLAAAGAAAQEAPALRDPGQKTVRMVRAAVPPMIDGVLDESAWASAEPIDDLHQVSPQEYAAPSERTEVYVLYDDDALYIGARLYDSAPELITAQNLRQNDNIGDDDRFFVTLDPFNSRRSGYFFGVNANGVRQDGL
ncbi:MAG TPA: carbohydrate binding family 9 domain-containing protein, partial [Vicinamibacterales bacterium]|nr:carbohydrate binding family 9 domain-containing protein [Vicinamibacterales bacterium]